MAEEEVHVRVWAVCLQEAHLAFNDSRCSDDTSFSKLDTHEGIVNGKANNLRMVEEVLRQKMISQQSGQASASAK